MADIPEGRYRMVGSERRPARDARRLGAADADERVTVTIALRRRPDGPAMPKSQDFLSARRAGRRPLTHDEFAAQYGASEGDLAKVASFAREYGLTVKESHAARRTCVVSGTVAQMNRAFGVELSRYESDHAGAWRGRDGFVHIPAELAGIVTGVFGLDNRNITQQNAADPPNTSVLTVQKVTQIYNFPENSAAGQTIGIVSVQGYQMSDIAATFGGQPPPIQEISINGAVNNGGAHDEITQDICIAGLAAPGAKLVVYFQHGGAQDWLNTFGRIVHPEPGDPVCSVVSCSFFICDGDDAATMKNESATADFLNALSDLFHDAGVQRMTVCAASGDTGSSSKVGGNPAAWKKSFPADGKAHVQFPASSPWVLCVGGTTIGNVNGSDFDEYLWNDPDPRDPFNWGTTGGGISDFFTALPQYQEGAGVPVSINDGHVGRGIPDVAANSSFNSGYGGITLSGKPYVANGTSAAAPLWAGLIAVINAALGENVGFVNPALYSLGSAVFRDIVAGDGPADNSNSGVKGYPATSGWDACTGWGSPNGNALLQGLRGYYGT